MTFARHGLGGEAVRAADRADICDTCASSSHFFARAKKVQKITEYRDTAPLIFFLPKSKSSSSRSSVLSACRSIFTKQNVPVVTRDGPAHYNVCTYFRMPIKLFLIRIWLRPPPPFSSGIRIKKNFENYGRPLSSYYPGQKRKKNHPRDSR